MSRLQQLVCTFLASWRNFDFRTMSEEHVTKYLDMASEIFDCVPGNEREFYALPDEVHRLLRFANGPVFTRHAGVLFKPKEPCPPVAPVKPETPERYEEDTDKEWRAILAEHKRDMETFQTELDQHKVDLKEYTKNLPALIEKYEQDLARFHEAIKSFDLAVLEKIRAQAVTGSVA